jgi:transcriptional regulator with XRE-family HTH domain
MKTFGEQLREARKSKKLTQETCARRSGLLVRTVERMESGKHDPSLSTLLKLTRELRCKFEFSEGGSVITIQSAGKVGKE